MTPTRTAMERIVQNIGTAVAHEDWPTVAAECRRLDLLAESAFRLQLVAPPSAAARPERFSIAEAAGILGISKSQLRRYIAQGELPHERYGRRVVLTQRSLDNFAHTRTTAPVA